MHQVFLSRRNLLTLLSKLDRRAAGNVTACTIIKNDNSHALFPQTIDSVAITAVEDEEYYNRPAGQVHPLDDPNATNA